jgi:hypothetical protein
VPIPVGAATAAWSQRRWLIWLVGIAIAIPVMLFGTMFAVIGGGLSSASSAAGNAAPSPFALESIPPELLRLYQTAGSKYGLEWEYIAAIGKVETDHGRLNAPGVRSGQNAHGCCAGPMQFHNDYGRGGGTWGAYGVDGNGDGKKDIYDPADAIPAAARYLKASGAPGDWDRAIFAYNHAGWYVDLVKSWAERYRGPLLGGLPSMPGGGGAHTQTLEGRKWLAPVPGTDAVCDRRIVPDVVMLLRKYKMAAGDCFALRGHANNGEHPLGLGIDLGVARGGSWELVGKAARDLGWRQSCASTGCEGRLENAMRVVLWNGYPGHGDPAHAGSNAHLHLSWQHSPSSPGEPARTVKTLLKP